MRKIKQLSIFFRTLRESFSDFGQKFFCEVVYIALYQLKEHVEESFCGWINFFLPKIFLSERKNSGLCQKNNDRSVQNEIYVWRGVPKDDSKRIKNVKLLSNIPQKF